MNRSIRVILGIFFLAVILFSAISLVQHLGTGFRGDITQEKIYTLSDGTRQILGKLSQPITLKLYYAETAALDAPDSIKFYNNYYLFVRELMDEYVSAGKGKVKLEVIDPKPFSEQEEEAVKYGLKTFPVSEQKNFVFGLVAQTEFGVTKTIPFFTPDRQNFIEYDVSKLIDSAVNRQKKRIGVLSALPVMGEDANGYMAQMKRMQGQPTSEPWSIISALKQRFEVSEVAKDTQEIKPDSIDVLLVIHPKDLAEKTQFALDQYLLKGGRAIICVDPHAMSDQPEQQRMMQGQGPEKQSSNLEKLFASWGLEMPADTFAGDRELTVKTALRQNDRPEPIMGFMTLTDKAMDKSTPITAQLGEVRVLFAGALKKVMPKTVAPPPAAGKSDVAQPPAAGNVAQPPSAGKVAGSPEAQPGAAVPQVPQVQAAYDLKFAPLIETTARGNTWKTQSPFDLHPMGLNPQRLMSYFSPGSEPVVMGYLISGHFPASFPGGVDVEEKIPANPNDPNSKESTKTTHLAGLAQAEKTASVAVFADVDFISDMLAFQRHPLFGSMAVGDNATLLLNTIDSLSGSNELIAIRSRGNYRREFDRVKAIEDQAAADTEKQVAEINAKITGFEKELNDLISKGGNVEQTLTDSKVIEQKRVLDLKILEAKKELRLLNQQKNEKIDAMGENLKRANMLAAPAVILVIAVLLAAFRRVRRQHYVSHASD